MFCQIFPNPKLSSNFPIYPRKIPHLPAWREHDRNCEEQTKARSRVQSGRAGKARTMSITVRKANGQTSIRLRIGWLAITVEFPL
jgi:hypothetical protein